MNYTEQPVTLHGLADVYAHMWDRGREELQRLGLTTAQAYSNALEWAQVGPSGILYADDVPVFASGMAPEGDHWFTWFMATEDFDRHAGKITRTVRRHAAAQAGDVYIYSVLVHPMSEKWFRVLGFERDEWTGRTAANWPLFRFRRVN